MVVVAIENVRRSRRRVADVHPKVQILRCDRGEPLLEGMLRAGAKPKKCMDFSRSSSMNDRFQHADQRRYANAGADQNGRLFARGVKNECPRGGTHVERIAHVYMIMEITTSVARRQFRLLPQSCYLLDGYAKVVLPRPIGQ